MLNKTDREGYNQFYKDLLSPLARCEGPSEYAEVYQKCNLSPYFAGGGTKGGVEERTPPNIFFTTKRKCNDWVM